MQGTYIPETNCVPREHGVAAILLFLFMVFISLLAVLNLSYFYISTFQSKCAVPNMAVLCSSVCLAFPVCCSDTLILIVIFIVLCFTVLCFMILSCLCSA